MTYKESSASHTLGEKPPKLEIGRCQWKSKCELWKNKYELHFLVEN